MQQLLDRYRIQSLARLVENEQLRFARQREEKRELRSHPLGEGANFSLWRELIIREKALRYFGPPVGVKGTRKADELFYRKVCVELLVLAHVRDVAPRFTILLRIVDGLAEEGASSARGMRHPEKHFDRRAFASAVAAKEAGDLLRLYIQVERFDSSELTEAFRELVGFDDARVWHGYPAPGAGGPA